MVWQFGDGSSFARPNPIVGTNDAGRADSLTLISGTGTPPGADPSCPDTVNGCPGNRAFLVNEDDQIAWQHGQAGVTGSRLSQLDTPVRPIYLPDGDILITGQGNERAIELTP